MMWNIAGGIMLLAFIIMFMLSWDAEFYSSTTLPPAKKIE